MGGTVQRRKTLGVALGCASALVVLAVVALQQRQQTTSLLMPMGARANINMRIAQDEQRLRNDLALRSRMMQALAKYPDGCVCDVKNCNTPNCDEENSDGPLCKCPNEKTQSMPGAATPWPMDAKFRGPAGASLRQVYARDMMRQQRAGMMGASRHMAGDAATMAVMPPFMGQHAREGRSAANTGARMQQKWVGSPGKFLPPDGDYPGGSTGIPEDGYLAFETGWANDGPYHGMIAPMQEAGIMEKSRQPQQLARMQGRRSQGRNARKTPSLADMSSDERVPASLISSDLFSGSSAGGPTVNAFQDLI